MPHANDTIESNVTLNVCQISNANAPSVNEQLKIVCKSRNAKIKTENMGTQRWDWIEYELKLKHIQWKNLPFATIFWAKLFVREKKIVEMLAIIWKKWSTASVPLIISNSNFSVWTFTHLEISNKDFTFKTHAPQKPEFHRKSSLQSIAQLFHFSNILPSFSSYCWILFPWKGLYK